MTSITIIWRGFGVDMAFADLFLGGMKKSFAGNIKDFLQAIHRG